MSAASFRVRKTVGSAAAVRLGHVHPASVCSRLTRRSPLCDLDVNAYADNRQFHVVEALCLDLRAIDFLGAIRNLAA